MGNRILSMLVWIQLAMLLSIFSISADVKVTAEAEESNIYENTPIQILVTISHSTKEAINLSSFKVAGKPIEAELIDEKVMTATGDLQLSMFHIELSPLPKGLHIVPEIQATVGSKIYRSIPTTFEVRAGSASSTSTEVRAGSASSTTTKTVPSERSYSKQSDSSKKSSTATLKFESFVDGPRILYPGQKTLIGYRYIFNTSLETTTEEIPLLEAKGLLKVGDTIVVTDEKDGVSTLTLTQIVKGDKPGEFTYGPSVLEAVPYQINFGGERIYAKEKVQSTASAVTIKVIPFPSEEKPPSFNGALGDFTWEVNLASSSTISVGDQLLLSIVATGKGDWDSVNLAELCCQPNISGQFRLSDLPSVGKLEGNAKRFDLHLIPLTTSITEIPTLEFSSFNPDTGKYKVIHTPPIPLKISPAALPSPEASPQGIKPEATEERLEQLNTVLPLEIPGNTPLKPSDLRNLPFGDWWVLFIIPFGIGVLIFQFNWINFLAKARIEKEDTLRKSDAIFKQALESPLGSSLQFSLINEALITRLIEVGEIQSASLDPLKLETTGLQGEVRSFLTEIDALRYSGIHNKIDEELLNKAKALFQKISEVSH